MSLAKRSLSGLIYGGVQFFLNLLQGIILVPFILTYWTSEQYGTWLAIYAFISLLRTLDTGHQNYVGNEFVKFYHTDLKKSQEILGSSLRFALCIGGFEFFIFLTFLLAGHEAKVVGMPTTPMLNIGIMSMLLMWWAVGCVGGIIVKIILPIGLYDRTIFWGIINRLLEVVILLSAIYFQWEIGIVFIVLAITMFIYSIIVIYDIKVKVPSVYPWWQYGSFKQGFQGFKISLLLTFNNFIEQFSSNGIIILIGNLSTISLIPMFTTMRTVSNVFLQANQIILGPITPDIIKFHVLNEKNKIKDIIHINWFVLNFVLLIPILIVSPYLNKLYLLWTKNTIPFEPIFCYSLIISIVIISFGKIMMSYLSGINNFQSLLMTNIVRIIILFPSSYFVLNHYNTITYIGLCVCFSEIFASIILPFYFVRKQLGSSGNGLTLLFPCITIVFLSIYMFYVGTHKINHYHIILLCIFSFVIMALQWFLLPIIIKEKLMKTIKGLSMIF